MPKEKRRGPGTVVVSARANRYLTHVCDVSWG